MKFIKIKFFIIGLFILGIINIPYFSFADTQIEVQDSEINIETIPNNPQPYEDVIINITSYATDLNKATITWTVDSGTPLYGIGKTSYSFKAKGPDVASVLTVTIKPEGSMNTITKKVVINPSEVEIMWEPVGGYTPPFYRGKSLPIAGGLIKAVAIPNTTTIKSGNGSISYTWKNNGETNLSASGYNKNSYIFKNSLLDENSEVTVVASAVSGNYDAENTIKIPTYDPIVVFYKKSPTEGIIYNNALNKEILMTEDEMTIVAEPYYFSLKGYGNNFNYEWKINNEIIETPSQKNELTIRPASRGGYASLNFMIENINELFQKASNGLKINL